MLVNPPLWTQNGTYSAEQDRSLIEAMVRTEGVVNTTSMVPTVITNSRQVSIGAGGAYVKGDYATSGGRGMYFIYNNGSHEVTLPVAETQPRYDLVVLRIYDSAVSGSVNEGRFEVVRGTPASSPRIPSTPSTAIPIAAVLSPAGSTQLQTNNLSDQRTVAQSNGTVVGNVDSGQSTRLNQLATPGSPVLITTKENPSQLYISTGSGFQSVGSSTVINQQSDLPSSAPDGVIYTSKKDGRTYQRRDNIWKFFNGWGPFITVGRTDKRTYLGPYVGSLLVNGPSNYNWGDEPLKSSSDYSTYFSLLRGTNAQEQADGAKAGGVTIKRPGKYHVEMKFRLYGKSSNTHVRSRLQNIGASPNFTSVDNQENFGVITKDEEYYVHSNSTVILQEPGSKEYTKLVPFIRTSKPVDLQVCVMRVELEYEF